MMRKKSGKQVGLSRQKMTSPRDSTVESEPAQKTHGDPARFIKEFKAEMIRKSKEKVAEGPTHGVKR
jgi:hypothetical protein